MRPGRHSKAHCSHKDEENKTWIWSLLFLHILSHMCVCLSVGVFTFEVLFKRLFAPTSQSCMSEFLEICNPWGKVVSDLTTFTNTGCKIEFCLNEQDFFGIGVFHSV